MLTPPILNEPEYTLYLASYCGKSTLLDQAISLWTWSKYSHSEMCYRSGDKIHLFSSSWRDGGVRSKVIPVNEFKWNNWDFVQIKEDKKTSDLVDFYKLKRLMSYDLNGIFFTHFLPFRGQHPKKYFCSEFCAEFLELKNPHLYTPGSLHNLINV